MTVSPPCAPSIALERDRDAHFTRTLGKRFEETFGTLGEAERRLWEQFVAYRLQIIPLFDLKARFPEFPDIERMLDTLVAARLVQRTIAPSAWQETTPVIRDWNIRYQIACPLLDLLDIDREFEAARKTNLRIPRARRGI